MSERSKRSRTPRSRSGDRRPTRSERDIPSRLLSAVRAGASVLSSMLEDVKFTRPPQPLVWAGCLLVVLICLGLSVSWLWPRPAAVPLYGYVNIPGLYAHAATFSLVTWGLCALSVLLTVVLGGAGSLVNGMIYLAPQFAIALFSTLVASDPGNAALYCLYWSLVAVAGASLAISTGRRALSYAVAAACALALVSSTVVALVAPTLGAYDGWNGIFEQKQVSGWVAVIATIVFALLPAPMAVRIAGFAAALGFCAMTNSKSALVLAAFCTGLYAVALPFIRSRGWGMTRSILAFAALAIVPVILFSVRLETFSQALSRDPTFETRTLVWPIFLDYTRENSWLGAGPGSFSGSWINMAVWLQNKSYYYSTHNTFITAFGELGWPGLVVYVLTLIYWAFILPFQRNNQQSLVAGALALQLMLGGFIEPTIGFFPTQICLSAFLIVAFATAALAKASQSWSTTGAEHDRGGGGWGSRAERWRAPRSAKG